MAKANLSNTEMGNGVSKKNVSNSIFIRLVLNQVTLLGSHRFANVVVDVDRLCGRRRLDHTHHCSRLPQTVRNITPLIGGYQRGRQGRAPSQFNFLAALKSSLS